MKLKMEHVILAAVIIGLSAYLVLHRADRTHYRLPQLPEIKRQDISKLEITHGGNALVVEKKAGAWQIVPEGYAADGKRIGNMVDAVADLAVTALVSESRQYERYGLDDEERITVKAWTGSHLGREFDVGKEVPTRNHAFIRLAGDDRVFHGTGILRSQFDVTLDDVRDKTVLSFRAGDIETVTITRKTGTTVLHRVNSEEPVEKTDETKEDTTPGPGKTGWQDAAGNTVDERIVKRLLSTLSSLTCESFRDETGGTDRHEPLMTITLKGPQNEELTVYAKETDEADRYPARSSRRACPFYLHDYRYDSLASLADELTREP
ncbi:MAG: DUF4340 domain-containing protein [Deltaproteobacteria bacterium]|nr:DUF4340 domain-containing protein [Deltaproteobacteria bacterium]